MKPSEIVARLEEEDRAAESLAAAIAEQICCGAEGADDDDEDDEDDDAPYTDDDFWEAIDLLETSRKCMQAVLRSYTISAARTKIINNLCDDIGQFVAAFVDVPEEKD